MVIILLTYEKLFRLLWSGDCANRTMALQLLYLVDIIALWGQFQYKPFAAACIRILKRISKGVSPSKLRATNLLKHQKIISAINFRSIQSHGLATIDWTQSTIRSRLAEAMTSASEVDRQLTHGLRMLSLSPYFIPERDGFIWLLHRELRGTDLLVIRVNNAGYVLPALLIFDASEWESPDFKRIVYEERARMPENVETDFRYDKDKNSVLQKCFNGNDGYCTMSEIQFCAILPLKRKQRRSESTSARNHLQPLEQLLDLQKLVDAAEEANNIWCICQEVEGKGNMILCDSTQCTIGWYHKQCVDLDEDYSAHDWLCRQCKDKGNIFVSTYENETDFEDGILPASDARIQRTKSLSRAWNNHKWPDPKDVRAIIDRKICCKIEVETNECTFRDTVEYLETRADTSSTRCEAILRENPLRLTHMRQRFRVSGGL